MGNRYRLLSEFIIPLVTVGFRKVIHTAKQFQFGDDGAALVDRMNTAGLMDRGRHLLRTELRQRKHGPMILMFLLDRLALHVYFHAGISLKNFGANNGFDQSFEIVTVMNEILCQDFQAWRERAG